MAALLSWPSAELRTSRRRPGQARVVGAYAGRARFQPQRAELLPEVLHGAIGRVIEFGFAGIAPAEEPFGGQELYLEWCRDDVLGGFVIPAQDLEFLPRQ
jgi:hypothetical protein